MDAIEQAARVVPKLSKLSAEVNGIAIVEWLHDRDRRTGRELYEWAKATFEELPLVYVSCSTRDDFFEALAAIEKKARAEQINYIVQIEAHGGDEGYEGPGLEGALELVHWDELRAPLVALNTAMRCNLVLISAACWGHAALLSSAEGPRAAFLGIVGFSSTVQPKSILEASKEFYRATLKERMNLESAVDSARRELEADEGIEFDIFPKMAYESLVGAIVPKFTPEWEEQVRAAHFRHRGEEIGIAEVRILRKQVVQQMWNELFMVDLYPENTGRFEFDASEFCDFVESRVRGTGTF